MKRLSLFILLTAALAGLNSEACTACFGQSDSSMAKGMNMGIMVLLMVIISVLFGVASFFVYVMKRSSRLEELNSGDSLNPAFSENTTNA